MPVEIQGKLLENRKQVVGLGLLLSDIVLLELLLVVLVSSLLVDRLVKDLQEDLLLDVLHPETLNASFILSSADPLSVGLLLMSFDL